MKKGMKWFQLDTDFFDHKFVKHTQTKFGDTGVVCFIKLMALIYKYYDISHRGQLNIKCTTLQQHFNCYEKKLFLMLDYFKSERKIEYKVNGDSIWVYMPKTIERADEYTKKVFRKVSGENPDKSEGVDRILSVPIIYDSNAKDITTSEETTKERPMSNLVSRICKNLIRRGGEC